MLFIFLFTDSPLVMNNRTLYLARYRLLNMNNERDSDLGEGRGYARAEEVGTNILWGMGEGAFDRFIYKTGAEVHSTYVNMYVSYGLIGIIGYAWIIGYAVLCRKRVIRNIACMSGLLLYFVTHNGIRNTLFWIMLALVIADNALIQKGEE